MSLAMPRAPSPSFGRPAYSPQATPAPFLTPPIAERPLSRRVHTLQPPRPAPYPSQSPPSSPKSAGAPKRPGAPHRSHSFCASGSVATYALASACTSSYLSSDKRKLVAPPLERTISSIGSKGNTSPPQQQMQRPSAGIRQLSAPLLRPQGSPTTKSRPALATIDGLLNVSQVSASPPTPLALPPAPCAAVPTIMIHPSTTPPRPSLSTFRTPSSSSTTSSRSSSFTTIMTPSTPRTMLFGSIEESDTEDDDHKGKASSSFSEDMNDIQQVAYAVDELSI